jgi:acyl carrier protein
LPPDVRSDVYRIVCDVFTVRPDEIRPDRPWEELGVGSFDLVEFVFAVCGRYSLELEPQTLLRLRTLNDVVAWIEREQAARANRS